MTFGLRKLAAAVMAGLVAALFFIVGASQFAGARAAAPSFDTCTNLKNWYVNPDETSRRPTATEAGLKFEGNDLIHHGTTGSIEGLVAGTFVAAPAPDQPSFFSVEVRNGDGTGYATLRWNTTTSKWNMVTGGQFYENASAADLVKMPEPDRSGFLVSFGVGYTNSPPGTVDTVVSQVKFKGVTYNLTCAPVPSASASSASPTATVTASGSAPPAVNTGAGGELALTGSKPWIIGSAGLAIVALGVVASVIGRRRRVKFTAR